MSSAKVLFDIRGHRFKLLALHPVEPWAALVSTGNVFELWNIESKILLRSFNCITLDDMKPTDIRDIIFFDRATSKPLSTNSPKQHIFTKKSNKNWVIFATDRRLFFFDYQTDLTRCLTEKDLDSKVIRKVEQVSDEAICVGTVDGVLKIVDVREFTVTKTFRGYYSKPITWIVAYKQCENDRPRVIAASLDSTMACWNVDSNLETPSFRFMMKKKSTLDNTSNDGQEIISMRYQRSTFRLLTLTEEYVTVWSTFSGQQLRRLKNVHALKDIQFFSHLNYPVDSFLSHVRGEDVYISTVMLDIKHTGGSITNFQAHNLINLKGIFNDGGNTKLVTISIMPAYPWVVCLNTTTGVFFLEINKVVRSTICFNDLFTTKLSVSNSKQFYVDQTLNQAAILPSKLTGMAVRQAESFNFFYLTNQRNFVNLKLVQVKIADMSHLTGQFNLIDLYLNPLLNERLDLKTSFDGRLIALISSVTLYVQVYIVETPRGFAKTPTYQRIDFHSRMKRVFSGMCTDFSWHQYKNQFCIIAPAGPKDQLIAYKKGNKGMEPNNKTESYQLVIYSLKNQNFDIFFKKPVDTKLKRCFSGPFFGCSNKASPTETVQPLTKDLEKIEFIETCQGTVKVFDPFIHTPEQIYWNYCGTVLVTCYDGYFVVYKVGQDGLMCYLRKIQKNILNGYFWEKVLFFVTPSTIEFMQILGNDTIVITIASNSPKTVVDPLAPQFDIFDPLYLDTLDQPPLQKPAGHLKILSIINLHLCVVDQVDRVYFVSLQLNPYIVFVMQIISGSFKHAKHIYQECQDKIIEMLDDIIKEYGVLNTDFLNS